MISAHPPATEINHVPVFCQHQQPFVSGFSKQALQRSRRCHRKPSPTCASSHTPPETCIDLPDPSTRLPSRSIRKQLEYLYQLEHPQLLWSSLPFDQQPASDASKRSQSLAVQLCQSPPKSSELKDPESKSKRDDYYANVGSAIRTLREETPFLFQQDLSYDIYRDDIVFTDTRNVFKGKKNYKTIFWSLRFHGKLFFSRLNVRVLRIWQPNENMIRLRWTVRGVPRVPWETEGIFDGVSEYKLDRFGKIYEHKVTNVQMRDPPLARSPLSIGMNLIPVPRLQGAPQAPCPTPFCRVADEKESSRTTAGYVFRFSWVRLYAALLGTVQLLRHQKPARTVLDM